MEPQFLRRPELSGARHEKPPDRRSCGGVGRQREGRLPSSGDGLERIVPNLSASDIRRTVDEHVTTLGFEVVMDHG